jgi:RHS repeat-associated protein
MVIKERSWSSSSYRFGFNGMEQDSEVNGEGKILDFGARIYDSRLGRWMSVDPLRAKYPRISPYHFSANNPIALMDGDGKEVVNADRIRANRLKISRSDLVEQLNQLSRETNGAKTRKEFKMQAKNIYPDTWKETSKANWNSYKNLTRNITDLDAQITIYETRADNVDKFIKDWAKEKPSVFNEVNSNATDMYLGMENFFDNYDGSSQVGGFTEPDFQELDDGTVMPKSAEFGLGSLVVMIEEDAIDRYEFEKYNEVSIINHESGHFLYIANNPKKYRDYNKKLKKEGRELNGGHNDDDKSGEKAKEYEKK